MFRRSSILVVIFVAGSLLLGFTQTTQQKPPSVPAAAKASPAEGYTIHVLAPHVVEGKVMGPFHHYCKVISPEPVIQCMIYDSTEANAPMTEVEYIVAKS